jgi:hypothetical protein
LSHSALYGIRVEQPDFAHPLWRQFVLQNLAQRASEPLADRRAAWKRLKPPRALRQASSSMPGYTRRTPWAA